PWRERIPVPPVAPASGSGAAITLYGREAVEDLEMQLAAGDAADQIDATIERIGLSFQIATRLTSWVAVTDQPTVDPRAAMRRERVPQQLPYGVSVEGLGLRAPTGALEMTRYRAAGAPLLASALAGPPAPPAEQATVETTIRWGGVDDAGSGRSA